jgi:hypothetical protein
MPDRAAGPPAGVTAVVMVALAPSLLGLGALPAGAATGAAARPSQPAATPTSVHGHGHGRVDKQGTAAIAVSVLGIVVVGVLIFYLGSLTVRRRMRDTPAPRSDREGGPPTPGRGLFG